MKTLLLAFERTKASIRAKVEHPLHVIKNLFVYRNVLYNGLVKNQAQLLTLFALGNVVLVGRCQGNANGDSVSWIRVGSRITRLQCKIDHKLWSDIDR